MLSYDTRGLSPVLINAVKETKSGDISTRCRYRGSNISEGGKIDLGRCFLAPLDEFEDFRLGCLCSRSLKGGKPYGNFRRLVFAVSRQLFPNCFFFGLPP